jgi:hypothetical protein
MVMSPPERLQTFDRDRVFLTQWTADLHAVFLPRARYEIMIFPSSMFRIMVRRHCPDVLQLTLSFLPQGNLDLVSPGPNPTSSCPNPHSDAPLNGDRTLKDARR